MSVKKVYEKDLAKKSTSNDLNIPNVVNNLNYIIRAILKNKLFWEIKASFRYVIPSLGLFWNK